jgi:hypothetical protein
MQSNKPANENKKRRFATCKHKQDGANLLQTIAQKGGTPEGFYDFVNKHGAGLGMQRIQAIFEQPELVNNLWLIGLKFYLKTL